MNANQRLLNNVERGCHRIGGPERTKVKCPEKEEKLEITICTLRWNRLGRDKITLSKVVTRKQHGIIRLKPGSQMWGFGWSITKKLGYQWIGQVGKAQNRFGWWVRKVQCPHLNINFRLLAGTEKQVLCSPFQRCWCGKIESRDSDIELRY